MTTNKSFIIPAQPELILLEKFITLSTEKPNDAGQWLIISYRKGDWVELKSIGLSLPIEQFYEEIVFDENP